MIFFFKCLYYLVGVLFIVVNLIKVYSVKEMFKFQLDLQSMNKNSFAFSKDERDDLKGKSCIYALYFIFNFIWLVIGIFTFNYQFILIAFAYNIIITKLFPAKNINNISNSRLLFEKAKAFIWALFYGFLILNSFHLHIQLF